MANLRIIHDNAVDRATSLAASSTAGTLVVANLQNDRKGKVHRSTGTSVTYTATWDDGEAIGGVVLPAANLTPSATIRVRLYSDTAGTTQAADSGVEYACPGLELVMWNWNQPLNANAFSYGGLAKVQVWFAEQVFAKRMVVDIVDDDNEAGYIDCARLVAGGYWEAPYNPKFGMEVSAVDTTESRRTDAGDNPSDAGTMHDEMSIELEFLEEGDRAELSRIIKGVGTRRNIVVSVLPDDDYPTAEQDGLIYGKRANNGMVAAFFANYSNKIDMKGW